MNNLICVGHVVNNTYTALSSTPLVATGTLCAITAGTIEAEEPPAALVKGLGATDVHLPWNVPIRLERVDLSKIEVKNVSGHASLISFIGHSVG